MPWRGLLSIFLRKLANIYFLSALTPVEFLLPQIKTFAKRLNLALENCFQMLIKEGVTILYCTKLSPGKNIFFIDH
jgi:hypothetical protein